MKLALEIVALPVADVDRAKAFYTGLGFRLDADFSTDRGLRGVQVTPPGAGTASVIFGDGLTDAAPGSVRGLHLVTPDLAEARAELISGGAEVSEIWHDVDGVFHWAGTAHRVSGAHPVHDSYASYLSFDDPDGNEWIVQQVIDRLPGR